MKKVKYCCAQCGALFAPTRPGHTYCSARCQGAAARARAYAARGVALSTLYYHKGGYYQRNPEAYK